MSRAMARAWVYRSMARRYSPRLNWQIPRPARALPSNWRLAIWPGTGRGGADRARDRPHPTSPSGPVPCRALEGGLEWGGGRRAPSAAGGGGDPPMHAPVQAGQQGVVAPQLQGVKVDVMQTGARVVVIAGAAAQLNPGQLRPQILQPAPGPARGADRGVVVGGTSLQTRQ